MQAPPSRKAPPSCKASHARKRPRPLCGWGTAGRRGRKSPLRRGCGDAREVLRRSPRERVFPDPPPKKAKNKNERNPGGPRFSVIVPEFSHVFYSAWASRSPAGWEDGDGCGRAGFRARRDGSGVRPADPGRVADTPAQPVPKREGRWPSRPCPHCLEEKTAQREAVTCQASHGPCQWHCRGQKPGPRPREQVPQASHFFLTCPRAGLLSGLQETMPPELPGAPRLAF